ncbi:TPA: hypothetical protein ACPZJO_003335 [Yersinia enterocolitica]
MSDNKRSLSDIPAFAQIDAVEMIKEVFNELSTSSAIIDDHESYIKCSSTLIRLAMLTLFEPIILDTEIRQKINICGMDGLYQPGDYSIKPMPGI